MLHHHRPTYVHRRMVIHENKCELLAFEALFRLLWHLINLLVLLLLLVPREASVESNHLGLQQF